MKGIHNFRASGDYDNDCTNPITPLCTQPDQVIKGKKMEGTVPFIEVSSSYLEINKNEDSDLALNIILM